MQIWHLAVFLIRNSLLFELVGETGYTGWEIGQCENMEGILLFEIAWIEPISAVPLGIWLHLFYKNTIKYYQLFVKHSI